MTTGRWAWAEIDLGAVAHNVEVLRSVAAPAAVWAVVKANGYGHGAVEVARAALDAGAEGLCVALTAEGVALRRAGIAAPILVLTQQPVSDVPAIVDHGSSPPCTPRSTATRWPLRPRVVIRSGSPEDRHRHAARRCRPVVGRPDRPASRTLAPALRVDAVFTHLACADEPTDPANAQQLATFEAALAELAAAGLLPAVVHAANSAAALAIPEARRSLVRAGIALYGITPGPGVAGPRGVAATGHVGAGAGVVREASGRR
jgi:alanine racemase